MARSFHNGRYSQPHGDKMTPAEVNVSVICKNRWLKSISLKSCIHLWNRYEPTVEINNATLVTL